ncbi:MAG: molecular chaperone HtpG, partial [Lachnospiraceae bacterium]|nr:molecular chaperone HtpG [Lachnospiraceae bacterium]
EKLKNKDTAAVLNISEESRRMQDMMKMYNMGGMDPSMFPKDETLVLNVNHPLVSYLLKNPDSENTEDFCKQIYDLAKLANEPLEPAEMTAFIQRSNKLMLELSK